MTLDNESAATQYGDLKGTISVDGFQGPFLDTFRARANVPKGYVPVGLGMAMHRRRPMEVSSVVMTLYCADADLIGDSAEEWRHYLQDHSRIEVFPFTLEVDVIEALEAMKRVSIKVWHNALAKTPISILEDG